MKQAATLSQMKQVIDPTQTNKLCPIITCSKTRSKLHRHYHLTMEFDLHQTILQCNEPYRSHITKFLTKDMPMRV